MRALASAVLLFLVCACATQPLTPWLTLSYAPGMIGKPWRMFISEDGRVALMAEERTSHSRLSSAELQAIRDAFANARLDEMPRETSAPYSDQPTLRINETAVYGPREFCARPDVQRFLALWNAVVSRVRVASDARDYNC